MYVNICKHCKKVFESKFRQFSCKTCSQKDSDMFDQIEAYLKKYPNSSAIQIAEGLEISAYEVLKFIEEGRLLMSRGYFERF